METENIQHFLLISERIKKIDKTTENKIKAKNINRNLTFLPYMVYKLNI